MSEFNIKYNDIGILKVKDVFVHYDYPRVFSCMDKFNSLYLFYQTDFDKNFDEFLIVKMSNAKYYKLISNQITLRESIIFHEDPLLILRKEFSNENWDISVEKFKGDINEYVTEYDNYVGSSERQEINTHNILRKVYWWECH